MSQGLNMNILSLNNDGTLYELKCDIHKRTGRIIRYKDCRSFETTVMKMYLRSW